MVLITIISQATNLTTTIEQNLRASPPSSLTLPIVTLKAQKPQPEMVSEVTFTGNMIKGRDRALLRRVAMQ